jgi:hypothetical protein
MSFLAADDFLLENALEKVNRVITKQDPDIIWVGMEYVSYEDHIMTYLGSRISEYKIYGKENRSEAIIELMRNTYYNAFCHYERISFLRKNGIDFYEPYYADCGGMTKAMAAADSMVCMKEAVYCLSTSTSQTTGHYIWDCYKNMFGSQWESISSVFRKEHFIQSADIAYAAQRIVQNHLSCLNAMCLGFCRNDCMKDIDKTPQERLLQLKTTFEYMPVLEMMYYYGRQAYTKEILKLMVSFCNSIGLEQFTQLQPDWLWRLMNVCLVYNDEEFEEADRISIDDLEYLFDIVLEEENVGAVGFEVLADNLRHFNEDALTVYSNHLAKVIEKYKSMQAKTCTILIN